MPSWTAFRESLSKFSFPAAGIRKAAPLLAGIALAAVSIRLAASRVEALKGRIEASTAPTEVVVASAPIRPGESFAEGNLAKARLPASGVGRRNVPASEFALLLGARSRDGLEPGDPVLWSDVEDPMDAPPLAEAVPGGRRAVTLPLDSSSSFAGLLRPGDRVDLLCTRGGGNGLPYLLEAVPVLAVDRRLEGAAPDDPSAEGFASATLSVSPSQSASLLEAVRGGSVQWMLRNGADNGTSPVPTGSLRRPPVELYEGGIPCDRSVRF